MAIYRGQRIRNSTEVRRQELIEDARRIVAIHGMEALTTKVLAKSAGITEGAIYRHFDSKKEILLGLIDEIEESLLERINEATNQQGSPLENLENILRVHLSYAERRRGVSFIVIAEVLRTNDRQLRARMQAVIERYLGTLEEIIAKGIRRGEINSAIDPSAAALALFGLIQGTVTLWRIADKELPLADRYEALWTAYRDGIRAR